MTIINSANQLIINKKTELRMRQKHIPQISIFEIYGEHETGQQLKLMSEILDDNSCIVDIAAKCLIDDSKKDIGRNGLAVDSIVRAALLKQMMGLTYDELSFYLQDSISYSSFARIDGQEGLSATSLQSCIKRLDAGSWEEINRVLLLDSKIKGLEKGRMVRIDSTVTETNIHDPSDSSLIWDCVRVAVRLLNGFKQSFEPGSFHFCDRSRATKKKAYNIAFKRKRNRVRLYEQLLKLLKETKGYLCDALSSSSTVINATQHVLLVAEAGGLLPLIDRVIDQTERRVLHGEKVPVEDKIVSIFEPDTDIIVKGGRNTEYGHKLNITTGQSGMVLDVVIEQGNPNDAARMLPMIERQKEIYGRAPRQAAADGCYASKDNVAKAKEMGVKDIAFNKKSGLKVEDMVKSEWVYKKLTKFRAGVEGNISCLKRRFGLSRCLWKGLEGFKSYVWASSVAYNLMQLARMKSAP